MKKKMLVTSLAAIGFLSAGVAQATPQIKNPSFEEGTYKPFLLPISPVGWISAGVDVVKSYTAPNGTTFLPTNGEYFAVLDGKASILQSLSFNFSEPIKVVFDWFSVYNDSSTGVNVNHGETTGWNTAEMQWGPGMGNQINFGMLGLANPWTKVIGLDNFRIKEVAKVAEPATLALILSGILVSFLSRRRKGGKVLNLA